jgi:peroxiredoxin
MPLTVGEQAPDFTLSSVTGESKDTFRLSDYLGKQNVVIAFYPADWSPT